MRIRWFGLFAPTALLVATGCLSFPHYPAWDPSHIAQPGQVASQVRASMGPPTDAWPAVPLAPEAAAAAFPGCNSSSEEWNYTFANCTVKLVFDNEGKLCHVRQNPSRNPFDPPLPMCQRRD